MIVITKTRSRRRRRPVVEQEFPTPEMIRAMTEEIREGWTPREYKRRASLARHFQLYELPLEPRRKGYFEFGDTW